jgi:hypothetical protein
MPVAIMMVFHRLCGNQPPSRITAPPLRHNVPLNPCINALSSPNTVLKLYLSIRDQVIRQGKHSLPNKSSHQPLTERQVVLIHRNQNFVAPTPLHHTRLNQLQPNPTLQSQSPPHHIRHHLQLVFPLDPTRNYTGLAFHLFKFSLYLIPKALIFWSLIPLQISRLYPKRGFTWVNVLGGGVRRRI